MKPLGLSHNSLARALRVALANATTLVGKLAGEGKRLFNTVMRALGQLEKRGIVKETSGGRRDRVYCAKALLDILEKPAQLQPAGQF